MIIKSIHKKNQRQCQRKHLLASIEVCHVLKYLGILLLTESIQAQDNITPALPPVNARGHICCPAGQIYNSGRCSVEGYVAQHDFNLSFITKNRAPVEANITWTYRPVVCPQGYNATTFKIGQEAWLVVDEAVLYLRWVELVQKDTEDFCVGQLPDGYVGVSCRPIVENLCDEYTCVQKCCGMGEVASMDIGMCVSSSTRTNFALTFQSVSGIKVSKPSDLLILHRVPNCQPILDLNPEEKIHEHFYLTRDGLLFQPAKEESVQETRFCLDYFIRGGVTGNQLSAFVCSGPGLPTEATAKDTFYAACLVVSAISLIMMILLNNLIPKLRAIQDLNQMCHVISLLVGEVTLVVGYLFTRNLHDDHCIANGIIQQFCLLSAFFWLSVICFDIHQYVRATTKLIPRSAIQGGKDLRFRLYCAYAWGCPFCITLATAILHFSPDYPDRIILRPGFGVVSCWMYGDIERLTFFYVWVGTLFVANIVFIVHTGIMLYKTGAIDIRICKKKTILEEGDNRATNRKNAEKFWQSFNLFALMALCWVTEILSWKVPPADMWIPTDTMNALQGFFVFVFFLRSDKKRELVKEALRKAMCLISESARKLSRSDGSSGTACTTFTVAPEIDSNQSKETEQRDE